MSILVFLKYHSCLLSHPSSKFLCGLVEPSAPIYRLRGLCPEGSTFNSIVSTSLSSSILTTLSLSLPTLEVPTLSLSLLVHELHNLLITLYGNATGVIPMQQLYIEAFLCDNFHIDHFAILETACHDWTGSVRVHSLSLGLPLSLRYHSPSQSRVVL